MARIEGTHNTLIQGTLQPTLLVAWSKARGWHGDTITLFVRTTLFPNGEEIALTIVGKQSGREVDTLPAVTIQDNAAEAQYTIDWKEKQLAPDDHEFILKASHQPFTLTAEAPLLLVDLAPLLFSA